MNQEFYNAVKEMDKISQQRWGYRVEDAKWLQNEILHKGKQYNL